MHWYSLLQDANLTYSHRMLGGSAHSHNSMAPHHLPPAPPSGPVPGGITITMGVPEEKVGVIIGKQGQVRELWHCCTFLKQSPPCARQIVTARGVDDNTYWQ